MATFTGCTEDMYRFFWEISFQNSKEFYEQNKERYLKNVREPMLALAEKLLPAALEMDPQFDARIPYLVSRIRRDTRFSKDKTMYRDHVWIGFKHPKTYTGEAFCVYCEFEKTGYGYGMGMYAPDPTQMKAIRERIMARPALFEMLVGDKALSSFEVRGETYRRAKFHTGNETADRFLNMKSLSFCFHSEDIQKTADPAISDEIIAGYAALKPVYRFLMGLD